MIPHQGSIVFETSRRLLVPYHLGDDTRSLQIAFGSLFDEAAHAVFLAGLDLDGVLVERFLSVRVGGEYHLIPATFLADHERLKQSVLESVPRPDDRAATTVEGVKIIVQRDELAG